MAVVYLGPPIKFECGTLGSRLFTCYLCKELLHKADSSGCDEVTGELICTQCMGDD